MQVTCATFCDEGVLVVDIQIIFQARRKMAGNKVVGLLSREGVMVQCTQIGGNKTSLVGCNNRR